MKYLKSYENIITDFFKKKKLNVVKKSVNNIPRKISKLVGKYVRINTNIVPYYDYIYKIAKVEDITEPKPDISPVLYLHTFNIFTKKSEFVWLNYKYITYDVTPEEIEELNFQLTANKYNLL